MTYCPEGTQKLQCIIFGFDVKACLLVLAFNMRETFDTPILIKGTVRVFQVKVVASPVLGQRVGSGGSAARAVTTGSLACRGSIMYVLLKSSFQPWLPSQPLSTLKHRLFLKQSNGVRTTSRRFKSRDFGHVQDHLPRNKHGLQKSERILNNWPSKSKYVI